MIVQEIILVCRIIITHHGMTRCLRQKETRAFCRQGIFDIVRLSRRPCVYSYCCVTYMVFVASFTMEVRKYFVLFCLLHFRRSWLIYIALCCHFDHTAPVTCLYCTDWHIPVKPILSRARSTVHPLLCSAAGWWCCVKSRSLSAAGAAKPTIVIVKN